jgi:hypothetical protein
VRRSPVPVLTVRLDAAEERAGTPLDADSA